MADDYEIALKVTPGAAIPTVQRVTSELGKAETQGERTGAAISRGMRDSGLAAQRAQSAIDRFLGGTSRGSQAAGRAVDGLTASLRREQQMLDRLSNGSHTRALQTLDSLFTKGKIGVQQYTDEVVRLNRELARTTQAKAPGAPKAPSGGIGSKLGGALTVAGGNLIAGAAAGAGQMIKDSVVTYQNLQNKMRVVAGEGESVSGMFDKIRTSSLNTRSSLETTVGAFQRLKGATKEMGLNTDDLLRITERMNKATKVSGASAAESSAGMQQLAQGLASGRLQGDELRSVLENLPYVADILAQSLGVTRGKLRELGEQGKLTSSVVVGAFEKMGSKIDKDFGKTLPTAEEQVAQLSDTFMVFVGQTLTAFKVLETFGMILGTVGKIVGVVGDSMEGLGDLFDHFAGEGASDSLGSLKMGGLGILIEGAALAKSGLEDLSDVLNAHHLESSRVSRAYIAQMEALRKLDAEEVKLEQTERTLAAARAAGLEVPLFDLDAAKAAVRTSLQVKQAWGIDLPPAFSEATKKATEMGVAIEKIKKDRAAKELAEDMERAANAALGFNKALAANADHWKSVREKLKDTEDALAQIAKTRALVATQTGIDPAIEMHGKGRQDGLDKSRIELQLEREKIDLVDALANSEYEHGAFVEDNKKKLRAYKQERESYNASVRDGRLSAEEAAFAAKALGFEESRASKILTEIRKPAAEYRADVAAINSLLNSGRISFDEYTAAIGRATDAYAGGEFRKMLEGASLAPMPEKLVSLGGGELDLGEDNEGLLDDAIELNTNVSPERAEMLRKYRSEVDALALALERPSEPDAPDLEKDLAIDSTARALERIKAPLHEYRRGIADAKLLLSDGAITAREYGAEIAKLEESYFAATHAGRGFEDGLARGLHAIREQALDVASAIETALGNAFGNLETAAGDMVVSLAGGWDSFAASAKASMKNFVDGAIRDLTRLMIKQAIAGIAGAVSGGGVSGGLFTGDAGLMAPSAPGFAFGGEGRVGGSGGPDSQLFVARVTPGEHYRFTPPGAPVQAAAEPAAPPVFKIINVSDRSEMRSFMEEEGETVFTNYQRRADPARRGRTTGR